ncbi:MAG: SLC13 family permease [Gammaproteobacteria bacterium]|nr:SLC13 family permease [Gammaproteobacteria bacterium]
MPPAPDLHALAVVVLTVGALYAFAREFARTEATSLGVLLLLVIMFYVFPHEGVAPATFFANFGHSALVTVCALLVVCFGLERTGALQPLVTSLARTWTTRPRLALGLTLFGSALASGFTNDTPQIVMLMPVLVACSLRAGIPPSAVLMPMGMSVAIGAIATTIGSGTTILAVGIAYEFGVELKMFDFTIPAAGGGLLGLLFLWLVAPRLLPKRQAPMQDTSPRVFDAVLHVNEASFAHGRTLGEVRARTQGRMSVQGVQRGPDLTLGPGPDVRLHAGDRLAVRDTPDRLKEFEQALGATLFNASDLDRPVSEAVPLSTEGQQLAEVVITRGSALDHRPLDPAEFLRVYRLLPLAIHRGGAEGGIDPSAAGFTLRAGDVLLVQGTRRALRDLRASGSILVLDGQIDLPQTERAAWAIGILALVVLAASTGLLPLQLAALCGVGGMLLTRCLRWNDLPEALSLPVIMLIVASLSLGEALTATGAVDYTAALLVAAAGGLPVGVMLSGLMLVIIVLANLVEKHTVAVIATPIAIRMAHQLGVPAEPFVVAAIFAANMSFATPIGFQGNMLLMTAGGYRFADFMRVGVPLTLIMWLAFSFLIPAWYGL